MTGTELLPCPFCGGEADYALGYGAACTNPTCGAGVPCRGDDFTPWNRRSDLCASGQQVRAGRWRVFESAFGRGWWGIEIDGDLDADALLPPQKIAREDLEAIVDAHNAALTPAPQAEGHPDDLAVDRFAVAMKAKLARKRAEGRGGWDRKDECSAEDLTYMLVQHIWKGDPLDVGNLAMMLHQRGEWLVLDSETIGIVPQTEMRLATREELLCAEILAELTRARAKFPGKNVTFAALVEEVGELATAIFEESADRVRKEAVQVAVMAMRMILDGDHCYEPWRAEKGLDPLDPELRAQAEGRDDG